MILLNEKWYLWSSRIFKLQIAAEKSWDTEVWRLKITSGSEAATADVWHRKMARKNGSLRRHPWWTLDGFVCFIDHETTPMLIIDRGGEHDNHDTCPAMPCHARAVLALGQVKDVEFAKAPDFDACLAAVRSLSGKISTCWARSVVDVVVVRACSVLTRFWTSLECRWIMFILFIHEQMFEIHRNSKCLRWEPKPTTFVCRQGSTAIDLSM